jgi:hypothetical protein
LSLSSKNFAKAKTVLAKCSSCSHKILPQASFCHHCGKPIELGFSETFPKPSFFLKKLMAAKPGHVPDFFLDLIPKKLFLQEPGKTKRLPSSPPKMEEEFIKRDLKSSLDTTKEKSNLDEQKNLKEKPDIDEQKNFLEKSEICRKTLRLKEPLPPFFPNTLGALEESWKKYIEEIYTQGIYISSENDLEIFDFLIFEDDDKTMCQILGKCKTFPQAKEIVFANYENTWGYFLLCLALWILVLILLWLLLPTSFHTFVRQLCS